LPGLYSKQLYLSLIFAKAYNKAAIMMAQNRKLKKPMHFLKAIQIKPNFTISLYNLLKQVSHTDEK